jgi:predicted metal-dependent phosphoesterase TrpH
MLPDGWSTRETMTHNYLHFKLTPASPAADLHCHSTYSDGTLTPTELVRLAAEKELAALALTDHDTVGGLAEFLAAPAPESLRRLGGVEISCEDEGRRLHLVGLGVRPGNHALCAMLDQVRDWRRQRNREMATRITELGLLHDGSALGRLIEEAEVLGRPHLAAALVTEGACRTMREAFSRFLGRGRPAYVARRVSPLDEALRIVREAGGVAVWAHPLTTGSLTVAKFQKLAADYAGRGLDGVEAYYSEFTPHQIRTVERIAGETGLLLSGGSDFHGEHIPDISLGTGYGTLKVPATVLPPLLERIAARGGVVPA